MRHRYVDLLKNSIKAIDLASCSGVKDIALLTVQRNLCRQEAIKWLPQVLLDSSLSHENCEIPYTKNSSTFTITRTLIAT